MYGRLAAPPEERSDLILIDVDHAPDDPLDEAGGRFYTEEGLLQASRHLVPGGVLGVWSYGENTPFSQALHCVSDEVRVEPATLYAAMVEEERTDLLFFGRNDVG